MCSDYMWNIVMRESYERASWKPDGTFGTAMRKIRFQHEIDENTHESSNPVCKAQQTSQVEVMKLDYLRLCSRAWDNPGLIWSCLRDNWNWVSHNCVVNSDSMGRHAVNSATVFRKFVRFQDGFQDQFQDRFLYETPSPPRSLAWSLTQPQVVWWVTSSFGIWGSRPCIGT